MKANKSGVAQYDKYGILINVFNTPKDAKIHFNEIGISLHEMNICRCARWNGNTNTHYSYKGYFWIYKRFYPDCDFPEKIIIKKKEYTIISYDMEGNFLTEYKTFKEASQLLNLNKSTITERVITPEATT